MGIAIVSAVSFLVAFFGGAGVFAAGVYFERRYKRELRDGPVLPSDYVRE